MHQDIKTFSDLTAIDTASRLRVQVQVQAHGTVEYTMTVNGMESWASTDINHIYYLGLFDPIKVEIALQDFKEGSSGLEVSLRINQNEVLPRYQHLSSNTKCYIDTKDPWTLAIPANFYQWYHEISGQGWIA